MEHPPAATRRRMAGGFWAMVGYLLSPLSWWNDPFINLPLAWLFASLVSLMSRRLFAPAMVVGYWLTNVAGLALMARGTAQMANGSRGSRGRELLLSIVAATGYTVLVVALIRFGVLQPLARR
jgi:hypothetical protein